MVEPRRASGFVGRPRRGGGDHMGAGRYQPADCAAAAGRLRLRVTLAAATMAMAYATAAAAATATAQGTNRAHNMCRWLPLAVAMAVIALDGPGGTDIRAHCHAIARSPQAWGTARARDAWACGTCSDEDRLAILCANCSAGPAMTTTTAESKRWQLLVIVLARQPCHWADSACLGVMAAIVQAASVAAWDAAIAALYWQYSSRWRRRSRRR